MDRHCERMNLHWRNTTIRIGTRPTPWSRIDEFLRDRGGATAIEYAIIIGLVSIAAIGGYSFLGSSVKAMFDLVSSGFVAALS